MSDVKEPPRTATTTVASTAAAAAVEFDAVSSNERGIEIDGPVCYRALGADFPSGRPLHQLTIRESPLVKRCGTAMYLLHPSTLTTPALWESLTTACVGHHDAAVLMPWVAVFAQASRLHIMSLETRNANALTAYGQLLKVCGTRLDTLAVIHLPTSAAEKDGDSGIAEIKGIAALAPDLTSFTYWNAARWGRQPQQAPASATAAAAAVATVPAAASGSPAVLFQRLRTLRIGPVPASQLARAAAAALASSPYVTRLVMWIAPEDSGDKKQAPSVAFDPTVQDAFLILAARLQTRKTPLTVRLVGLSATRVFPTQSVSPSKQQQQQAKDETASALALLDLAVATAAAPLLSVLLDTRDGLTEMIALERMREAVLPLHVGTESAECEPLPSPQYSL